MLGQASDGSFPASQYLLDLQVSKGHRYPRYEASPYWHISPITQLSPYLTLNPGRGFLVTNPISLCIYHHFESIKGQVVWSA